MELTESDVSAAARILVAAFAATDTDAYFDCFAPDATFIFYSEPARLDSRNQYRNLWQEWVAGGWRVIDCISTNAEIRVTGPVAVYTHDVLTTIAINGDEELLNERETIVFSRHKSGALLAVHEHLSPAPASSKATE
jgi:ketosteroid isomerase-like protein